MPTALRSLDDKVLGRPRRHDADEPYPEEPRTERREVVERPRTGSDGTGGGTGDGLREFLGVVYRVSRLVLLTLAAVLVLGIVFVLAPTNADNPVVELVADVSSGAAGPFRDVFTADDAEREQVVNYAFAAGVYLVLAFLVTKLPGGKR